MGSKPIAISASRGASILGLNDFQTAFEVWQLIMEERQHGFNLSRGYVLPDPVDNASVRWGSAFESAIIKLAEQKQGKKIISREYFFTHGNVIGADHFMTCHIDGAYDDETEYINTLHEGKTTSYWNWKDNYGEPNSDRVPTYIAVQCQHQMLCTGADKCIVSVLVWPKRVEEFEQDGWQIIGDNNIGYAINDGVNNYMPDDWAYPLDQMGYFHQYEIHADKELHKMLIEKYTEFWQKNIIEEIPPEPTNYDDIKRRLPCPCGIVLIDDETQTWIEEYQQINQELGTSGFLAKRKEQLKVMILNKHKNDIKKVDDEEQKKLLFKGLDGKQLLCYNKGKLTVSKLKEC